MPSLTGGLGDHRLHRSPEVAPAVDGPMGVERSGIMRCIDHGLRGLRERPEGGERQPPIPFGVRPEVGGIGFRDGSPDEVDHRAAGGVGLAWHARPLT